MTSVPVGPFGKDSRCPECREHVQVWADDSGGITINFACDNPECASGKGPWDTPRPEHCPTAEEAWADAQRYRAEHKEKMRRLG